MLYDIVTNLMVVMLIFLMADTIYDNIKDKNKKVWLDYLIIGIGIVWVAFYIYVLLAEPENSATVGAVFVRPLNILTFLTYNILSKIRLAMRSNNANHG